MLTIIDQNTIFLLFFTRAYFWNSLEILFHIGSNFNSLDRKTFYLAPMRHFDKVRFTNVHEDSASYCDVDYNLFFIVST